MMVVDAILDFKRRLVCWFWDDVEHSRVWSWLLSAHCSKCFYSFRIRLPLLMSISMVSPRWIISPFDVSTFTWYASGSLLQILFSVSMFNAVMVIYFNGLSAYMLLLLLVTTVRGNDIFWRVKVFQDYRASYVPGISAKISENYFFIFLNIR